MSYRNLISVLPFIGILTVASAFSVAAQEHWTEFGKVRGVNIDMRNSPGRVLIEHEIARNDNCSNSGNFYYLELNHPQAEWTWSLLLTAEATQKEVQLAHSGCSAAGYPVVKVISTF